MEKKLVKRYLILGILFFLPVAFLLFLYPAEHHYNVLETVKSPVRELHGFKTEKEPPILLEGKLTILGFFGKTPLSKHIAASNLKELIYDKFMGFKGFQIVIIVPQESMEEALELKKEIMTYETLEHWHFVFGSDDDIYKIYNSLEYNEYLDINLATDDVFIIDKELNQRGRLDDRTDNEKAKNIDIYPLLAYDCIEVAEIKNKMSEDLRILFTEYRQKRKGNFDSTARRSNDLKETDE